MCWRVPKVYGLEQIKKNHPGPAQSVTFFKSMLNADAISSGRRLIRWREIEWELLPLADPSARHSNDRQLFRWHGKTVVFRSDAAGTGKNQNARTRSARPCQRLMSHQNPDKLAHQTLAGRSTLADRLLFGRSSSLRVHCREHCREHCCSATISRHLFSKVLYVLTSYSKYTRAMTFQKLCQHTL